MKSTQLCGVTNALWFTIDTLNDKAWQIQTEKERNAKVMSELLTLDSISAESAVRIHMERFLGFHHMQ